VKVVRAFYRHDEFRFHVPERAGEVRVANLLFQFAERNRLGAVVKDGLKGGNAVHVEFHVNKFAL
jgi:hypothetical protein